MPYLRLIEMLNHPRQGDLTIDLSDDAAEGPRHLILTGPNASGKTTILRMLAAELDSDFGGSPPRDRTRYEVVVDGREAIERLLANASSHLPTVGEVETAATERQQIGDRHGYGHAYREFVLRDEWSWSGERPSLLERWRLMNRVHHQGLFIATWIGARRDTNMAAVSGPTSKRFRVVKCSKNLASGFHQFLVDLNVRARLARSDKPGDANTIERWLGHLEAKLADLFDLAGLKMKFSYEPYKVEFVEPSGLTYGFEHLAAGHASILSILAEILLRIDGSATPFEFDDPRLSGVVLIDELEVHLHPSLQERVLPFLTGLFPRLQFVVATHSPAVISSIDNAWVFDLKTRERVASSELRGVRYGDLMVDHFGISSDVDLVTTRQLQRLVMLSKQAPRDANADQELRALAQALAPLQHPLVLEVQVQLALEARPKASA